MRIRCLALFLIVLCSLFSDGKAQACPVGQYRAGVCTNCPAGTFRATTGATAITDCETCPVGTFSAAGASQCSPCAAGLNSPAGSSACSTTYPVFALAVDWGGSKIRRIDLGTAAVTSVSTTRPYGFGLSPSGGFALIPMGTEVRRLDLVTWEHTAFVGSATSGSGNGFGTDARFTLSYHICITTDGSFALVTDTTAQSISSINMQNRYVTRIAGDGTAGYANGAGLSSRFTNPRYIDIARDGSFAIVAEINGHRVRRLDLSQNGAAATVSLLAGSGAAGLQNGVGSAAQFTSPEGIAITSDMTTVFVGDRGNKIVRRIIIATREVSSVGSAFTGEILGVSLAGLDDFILVGDFSSAHRIFKVSPTDGLRTAFVGSGTAGSLDGSGVSATINQPMSTAIFKCYFPGYAIQTDSNVCAVCAAGKFGPGNGRCTPCTAGTFSSTGASQCTPCAANTGTLIPGSGACCAANQYVTAGSTTCTACPQYSWSVAGAAGCTANVGYVLLPSASPLRVPASPYMSADTVTINGEVFVATSSSNYAGEAAYRAFTNTVGTAAVIDQWTTSSNSYDSSGVYVVGSTPFVTLIDGLTVNGEWLQLQMSNGRVFGSYDLVANYGNPTRMPKNFVVAVSNDGKNWISIGARTEASAWAAVTSKSYTTTLTSWTPYTYIRLVVRTTSGAEGYATIDEWKLYPADIQVCSGTCASNVKRCPPSGTGVCCTAGQFFVEGTHTACQPCPYGTYTLNGGQTACLRCASASPSYAASAISSACTTCPAEAGLLPSSGVCAQGTSSCPAGTYTSGGICFYCAAGKYSTATNAASCTACLANSFSPAGSSAATQCVANAGYYRDISGNFQQCPDNTFSAAGAVGCVAMAGYYVSGSGTRFPRSAMSAGTNTIDGESFTATSSSAWGSTGSPAWRAFNDATTDWYTSATTTYDSSTGAFIGTGGSAYSTTVDSVARAGEWMQLQAGTARQLHSYSIKSHVTFATAPTSFIMAGSTDGSTWTSLDSRTGITWTNSGQIQTFTLSQAPFNWNAFTYFRVIILKNGGNNQASIEELYLYAVNAALSTCTNSGCTPGVTNFQCTPTGTTVCCGAGTYWVPSGTNAGCTACPVGTSGDGSRTACTSCAVGTFAGITGSSVCQSCASGTTSDPGAAMCYTNPDCPVGQYKSGGACTNCPAGKFRDTTGATAESDCVACIAGKYSWWGATTCEDCPTDKFSADGASICCSRGQRPVYETAECVDCQLGSYGDGIKTVCDTCAAGTFAGTTGKSVCDACTTGTYSGTGVSACTPCSGGTYRETTGGTAQTDCDTCDAGTYSGGGLSVCTKCDVGSFGDTAGATAQSACDACVAGTYAPTRGLTECLQCSAGTYSPDVSASSSATCITCSMGTSSTGLGMGSSAACSECASGSYSQVLQLRSSPACETCLTGTESTSTQASPAMFCTFRSTYALLSGAQIPPSPFTSSADLTNGGRVFTVSAITDGAGNEAFRAFDGSSDTTWQSAASYTISAGSGTLLRWGTGQTTPGGWFGAWLQIQVSTPIALGRYNLICSDQTRAPYGWTILGSNDGNVWDRLSQVQDTLDTASSYVGKDPPRDFFPGQNYDQLLYQWRTFTHFRLVVEYIRMTAPNPKTVINEWRLYEGSVGLCPAGSYCPDDTKGSRVYCPANRHGPDTAQTASSACRVCPDGQEPTGFTDPSLTLGATSCARCSIGKAGTGGTCTLCAAGSYADATGLTSCTLCIAGTFSGATGASTSSTCTACTTGRYSVTAGASSATSCTLCAAGTFSAATGASSQTTCESCAAGTFGGSTGLSVCTQCPDNSNSEAGFSACRANAGYYWGWELVGSEYTANGGTVTITSGIMQAGRVLAFNGDMSTAISTLNINAVTVSIRPSGVGSLRIDQMGHATIEDRDSYPVLYSGGNVKPPMRWLRFDDVSTKELCLKDHGSTPNDFTTFGPNPCAVSRVYSMTTLNAFKGSSAFISAQSSFPVFGLGFKQKEMQTSSGFTVTCWMNLRLIGSGVVLPFDITAYSFDGTNRLSTKSRLTATQNTGSAVLSFVLDAVGTIVTTGEIIGTGAWHHIVIGTNPQGRWFYWVNGQAVGCPSGCTVSTSTNFFANDAIDSEGTQRIVLGGFGLASTGVSNIINGGIDDFRIYGGLLSTPEVSRLYNGYVGVYQPAATPTACGDRASACPTPAKPFLHCTPTGTPVCCGTGEFFVSGVDTACRSCASAFDASYNSDGSASTCTSCPAGQSVSGTACATCAAGTYTALSGQSACLQCDAGTYFSGTGADRKATCALCVAGTYSTASGAIADTVCLQSDAGAYCTGTGIPVSARCPLCIAGTYSTSSGAIDATTCSQSIPGTYCTGTGTPASAQCTLCHTGTYSTASGATISATCTLCIPGTFSTGSGIPASARCTLCGTGTYSTASGAVDDTTCQRSAAGTYCTGTGAPASGQCTLCHTGTYSTASGSTISSTCTLCDPGTFSTGSGIPASVRCTLCRTGTYSTVSGAVDDTTCQRSAAGTYCTGTGTPASAQCTLCHTGTYSTASGATISGTCALCIPGTFSTGSGIPASAQCTLCGTGTYSTASGPPNSATCTLCAPGTFATGSGLPASSQCTLCGTGTYSTASGLPTSAACALCVPGTFSTASGIPASSQCTLCRTGTYSTASGLPTSAACTLCVPGTYATGSGLPDSAKCTLCVAGAYSTGSGMIASSVCTLCGAGEFSTASGANSDATCDDCAAGTFSGATGASSAGTCTKCTEGSYSTTRADKCTNCPDGSSTPSSGATSIDNCVCNQGLSGTPGEGCTGCPKNFYCFEGSKTPCPSGYFSLPQSTLVTDCKCQQGATFLAVLGCTCNDGLSKLQNNGALGDRECAPCPANSYCSRDATTACPDNSRSPANSSVVTDCRCDAGYYWNETTQTCPICPAGSYCKNNQLYQCPTHTKTLAPGAQLQRQCVCNGGFTCKAVRDVSVVIRFQLTAIEFNERRTAIQAKIAELARVPVDKVVLQTYSTATVAGSRRLLLSGASSEPDADHQLIEISAHIFGVPHGVDFSAPIGV